MIGPGEVGRELGEVRLPQLVSGRADAPAGVGASVGLDVISVELMDDGIDAREGCVCTSWCRWICGSSQWGK